MNRKAWTLGVFCLCITAYAQAADINLDTIRTKKDKTAASHGSGSRNTTQGSCESDRDARLARARQMAETPHGRLASVGLEQEAQVLYEMCLKNVPPALPVWKPGR